MCGIAGILEYKPDASDLEAPLTRMLHALRHRGPDDEGVLISEDGRQRSEDGTESRKQPSEVANQRLHGSGKAESRNSEARCGLVHTRLTILDLSPAGHQPMGIAERTGQNGKQKVESRNQRTEDGGGEKRYWITFNGEIYNFRELRRELESQGVPFHSQSDTEVILRLYERDGARCVDQLAGMFAFAIWDAQEEKCFLARDPLGIKPLCYFQQGNRLVFASELRALLESEFVPRRLNLKSLQRYLVTGSVTGPDALIEGVKMLPAGHSLTWQRGRTELKQFWRMSFNSCAENTVSGAALARTALLDSMRRHFVSDVPVGLFLSGGLDSTALLALAQQLDGGELKTFCISFDDPRFNEGEVARRTAAYFGSQHFDWRLDAPTGALLLENFLSKLDQPTIDGFNTFCVSKHAHDHGVKAVLSGLGGDELFGGYGSFRNVPRLYRWSRRLEPVAPLRAAAGRWLEKSARRAPMRRLGSYLQTPPSMARAYETYRGIYTPAEAARLVRHYTGQEMTMSEPVPAEIFNHTDPSLEDEVSRLEIENYMRCQLLRDSDVMSMAWGLELRVPFVDRQFVEALTTIPAACRLAAKKNLLRQAVPEIPDWVMRRPKQGFLFPFEGWLSAEWKPFFENVGKGSGVRIQTWYQKWSLFVLARWCESLQISLPGASLHR
jgi:asparagine synthase (glutamine-hydrolysing)